MNYYNASNDSTNRDFGIIRNIIKELSFKRQNWHLVQEEKKRTKYRDLNKGYLMQEIEKLDQKTEFNSKKHLHLMQQDTKSRQKFKQRKARNI